MSPELLLLELLDSPDVGAPLLLLSSELADDVEIVVVDPVSGLPLSSLPCERVAGALTAVSPVPSSAGHPRETKLTQTISFRMA